MNVIQDVPGSLKNIKQNRLCTHMGNAGCPEEFWCRHKLPKHPLGFAGFAGFAVHSSIVSSFAMIALLAIRTEMTSPQQKKPHSTLVASKETGSSPLRCTLRRLIMLIVS